MSNDWTARPPQSEGFYEVRMDPAAWGMNDGDEKPGRLVFIDPGLGRFDAGEFGGSIKEPIWRWRGPVVVPDHLPDGLE
ncbi:MAG: hypothetical protein JNM10_00270 [Planctomycetia bacterium]|nr:hypothetical protein [Planctomycetia bacterium]